MAVFKVFYQHNKDEVIVRENTQTIYVRDKLRNKWDVIWKTEILILNLLLN